jgi:hypothetical protein
MPQDEEAEQVIRLVQDEADLQARMDAEARETAAALINRHIDPHSRIVDLASFLSALANAIKAAREQGHVDATGELGKAEIRHLPSVDRLHCR